MSVVELDYDAAHQFVDAKRRGMEIYWKGWDMIVFKPTPFGFSNEKGAYRSGRWGMQYTVPVGDDGKWRVPAKDVHVRNTR